MYSWVYGADFDFSLLPEDNACYAQECKGRKKVRNSLCLMPSYKSRTGYCTVFSLQRDVPNLRIGILSSHRFEFQKIKKY